MKKLKKGSKILIANDSVGITGVQVTVSNISRKLEEEGYEVVIMQPTDKEFLKITIPLDNQFQWTLFATPVVTQKILSEKPDAILITTVEAPIGRATRDVCEFLEDSKVAKKCPYTLMYTTNHGIGLSKNIDNSFFGNLANRNSRIKDLGDRVIYSVEEKFLRNRFLGAKRVIVNAQSSKEKLAKIGIKNIVVSPRGIDHKSFHLPTKEDENPYLSYQWYKDKPKPVLLYLGRVAFEKDIQLFLEGDYPDYHRVVAGDGAALSSLKKEFGEKEGVHFVGSIAREKVPGYFMYARLNIFPSSFDTFGITIIESAACGTPVIAFDVPGPKDVIKPGVMGVVLPQGKNLFEDLDKALKINRKKCSSYTRENFSWGKSTEKLLENLYPIKWGETLA